MEDTRVVDLVRLHFGLVSLDHLNGWMVEAQKQLGFDYRQKAAVLRCDAQCGVQTVEALQS